MQTNKNDEKIKKKKKIKNKNDEKMTFAILFWEKWLKFVLDLCIQES